MDTTTTTTKIIRFALIDEDKAKDDLTSRLLPPYKKSRSVEAVMVAKSGGVICGVAIVRDVMREIDARSRVKVFIHDGKKVKYGDIILRINASASAILSAERTALNFIQRLSGIATLTSEFVSKTQRYGVKIYDTRKTTPGLRSLEKYAVRCGGGENHRLNLSQMVFVKDNHLAIEPDPRYWVAEARRRYRGVEVEIECVSVEGARAAALAGADIVLLDNMPLAELKSAISVVKKINPRILIEVSGGVNLSNVASVARLGPDRISVGALTHSAPSLDISLEIITPSGFKK